MQKEKSTDHYHELLLFGFGTLKNILAQEDNQNDFLSHNGIELLGAGLTRVQHVHCICFLFLVSLYNIITK
jgi:hypothetical protein